MLYHAIQAHLMPGDYEEINDLDHLHHQDMFEAKLVALKRDYVLR